MSEQTVDLPISISDSDIFESALTDPPETPQPAEPSPAPAESTPEARERDEKGRFVAKPDDGQEAPVTPPAPEAPQAPETPVEAPVPSWRLREQTSRADLAEARYKALESQIAQLQENFQRQQPQAPLPEPPDIFADPQGWQAQLYAQQSNGLEFQKFEFSEMLARERVGDAKVEEALKWAGSNLGPSEKVRIAQARHPFNELLRLQDERKVLAEIGTDPNAYVQKKLEEALNNPEFLAKAVEKIKGNGQAPAKGTAPVVQIPPSLSRQTAAAGNYEPAMEMTDQNLFAYANQK